MPARRLERERLQGRPRCRADGVVLGRALRASTRTSLARTSSSLRGSCSSVPGWWPSAGTDQLLVGNHVTSRCQFRAALVDGGDARKKDVRLFYRRGTACPCSPSCSCRCSWMILASTSLCDEAVSQLSCGRRTGRCGACTVPARGCLRTSRCSRSAQSSCPSTDGRPRMVAGAPWRWRWFACSRAPRRECGIWSRPTKPARARCFASTACRALPSLSCSGRSAASASRSSRRTCSHFPAQCRLGLQYHVSICLTTRVQALARLAASPPTSGSSASAAVRLSVCAASTSASSAAELGAAASAA
jgi:hypothetical protein